MNNVIGWEAIGAHPHKRSRYTEAAERINKFASRGVDLMLDGVIAWDLELVNELYELAHICEQMAGGIIEFDRHEIILAREIHFVTT